MLVNRHHVRYLIDLGHVAEGKTASQLEPLKDRIETFLNTLSGAATPAARRAFEDQMQRLAKDDRPWSAIRRPDPTTHIAPDASTPRRTSPAVALLLAQVTVGTLRFQQTLKAAFLTPLNRKQTLKLSFR